MKKLLFLLLFAFPVFAQVPTNIPNTVIQNFVGAPTGACTNIMVATNVSNGDFYDCLTGSWVKVGGGGSGTVTSVSGTSPVNVATGTTTPVVSCVTCAIGPGSSTANHLAEFASTDGVTLKDGGAAPTGTVSSVVMAGTSNEITVTGTCTITSTGTCTFSIPSPFVAPGNVTATGSLSSTSDGVHAGDLSLVGNTANPSLTSNTFNIFGPPSATFTAYAWQVPSTAPGTNTLPEFGVAASGASPITYVATTGTGNIVQATSPTITTPAVTGTTTETNNGLAATNGYGYETINSTAATSSVQQYSPAIHLEGQGWKTNATAGSQSVDWWIQNQITSGAANPCGYLNFSESANGAGPFGVMSLNCFGQESVSSTMEASGFLVEGTTFTATGCATMSALVGGATAGQFATTTSGVCTATITMGNYQTATNKWSCWVNDVTSGVAGSQVAAGESTTVAVLKVTTTSGDTVRFGCEAF